MYQFLKKNPIRLKTLWKDQPSNPKQDLFQPLPVRQQLPTENLNRVKNLWKDPQFNRKRGQLEQRLLNQLLEKRLDQLKIRLKNRLFYLMLVRLEQHLLQPQFPKKNLIRVRKLKKYPLLSQKQDLLLPRPLKKQLPKKGPAPVNLLKKDQLFNQKQVRWEQLLLWHQLPRKSPLIHHLPKDSRTPVRYLI